MTDDQVVVLIIVVGVALFLLYLTAGLIVIFTGFVLSLLVIAGFAYAAADVSLTDVGVTSDRIETALTAAGE